MPDYDGMSPGQVLADASVAEFIKLLGLSIADAQRALDENSVNQIGEFIAPRDSLDGRSLLDLGLSPAFYHYQHADLVCSLQLSLRVEKDFSIGLNLSGSYGDTSNESTDSSSSETTSESRSSTSTQTRTANIEIDRSSAGSLTIGGQNFSLSGNNAADRLRNLQRAVTGDSGTGVARILYQLRPSPITIDTDADEDEVHTTDNTVAFIGGGFERAVIRIGENTDTDYQLDDDPNVVVAVTTAQSSIAAYAAHVEAEIRSLTYNTRLIAPDQPLTKIFFNTGEHIIPPERAAADHQSLANLARLIRTTNTAVEIEGYADQQQFSDGARSDELNRQLGDYRANEIRDTFLANNVPTSLITMVPSRGDAAAGEAGDDPGTDNQEFRRAEVRTVGRTAYWLLVHANDGGPNLSGIMPDRRGQPGNDNGFFYLYMPTPLELNSKKATIDGVDFPFRGAAVSGLLANSPEAYALNLASDINANASTDLEGTAAGNITTVTRGADPYELTLVTTERRQINLSGTSGVTVTNQFSRTQSRNLTQQNSGNTAVAVGATFDVRFSRQFEMNVTGNSSISARLVSIPAPPDFLETIKSYLDS